MKPVRDCDERMAALAMSARQRTVTFIKEPKATRPMFSMLETGDYFVCEEGIVHIKTYPTGATQLASGLYFPFDKSAPVRPVLSVHMTVTLKE